MLTEQQTTESNNASKHSKSIMNIDSLIYVYFNFIVSVSAIKSQAPQHFGVMLLVTHLFGFPQQ